MNDSSDRRPQKSGSPASPDPFLGKIDAVLAEDIKEELRFRKEFFLYAFKALDFNGIDGDYAEFGCFGGTAFCMAHEQIRRRRVERHM